MICQQSIGLNHLHCLANRSLALNGTRNELQNKKRGVEIARTKVQDKNPAGAHTATLFRPHTAEMERGSQEMNLHKEAVGQAGLLNETNNFMNDAEIHSHGSTRE